LTRAKLNELIKGKRGITADTALDLADFLETSAKYDNTKDLAKDLGFASQVGEI
jgi:plasmid maintenance system antidote protein VapI